MALSAVQGLGLEGTRWDHSRYIVHNILGVYQEAGEFEGRQAEACVTAAVRKQALRKYRQRVVMPRAWVEEIAWLAAAMAEMNNKGWANYADVVPFRRPRQPPMR